MAPKSVTFQRHDHLVSVLFGDLLSHSYNITFSMFLYLVLRLWKKANAFKATYSSLVKVCLGQHDSDVAETICEIMKSKFSNQWHYALQHVE